MNQMRCDSCRGSGLSDQGAFIGDCYSCDGNGWVAKRDSKGKMTSDEALEKAIAQAGKDALFSLAYSALATELRIREEKAMKIHLYHNRNYILTEP